MKCSSDFEKVYNRLISVIFQVQFHAYLRQKKAIYSRILVDAASFLKWVIVTICFNLFLTYKKKYKHRHLCFTGKYSE